MWPNTSFWTFFVFPFFLASINISCANNDEYNTVVTLSGGKFRMGSSTADTKRGELPAKNVGVKPFVIDKYPVTNENFRKFVRAKKFKTEAERFGWSFAFHSFVPEEVRSKITQSVPVCCLVCVVNMNDTSISPRRGIPLFRVPD